MFIPVIFKTSNNNMSFVWVLTVFIFVLLLPSCFTTKSDKNFEFINNNKICETNVIARFHYEALPKVKGPAIGIKGLISDVVLPGEIIEIRDKSVIFRPKKEKHYLLEKEYLFEDLNFLIDSNRKYIYKDPELDELKYHSLVIELKAQNSVPDSTILLVLPADTLVYRCFPPDNYEITNLYMLFERNGKPNNIASFDFPELFINIKANSNNYIGDIFVNHDESPSDSLRFKASFKVRSKERSLKKQYTPQVFIFSVRYDQFIKPSYIISKLNFSEIK